MAALLVFGAVLSLPAIAMERISSSQALVEKVGEDGDPWPRQRFEASENPGKFLPKELAKHVDATIAKAWKRMPCLRRRFPRTFRVAWTPIAAASPTSSSAFEEHSAYGIGGSDDRFLCRSPRLAHRKAARFTVNPVIEIVEPRHVSLLRQFAGEFPIARDRPPCRPPRSYARRLRALTIRDPRSRRRHAVMPLPRARRHRSQSPAACCEDDAVQPAPMTADLLCRSGRCAGSQVECSGIQPADNPTCCLAGTAA